MEAQTQYNLKLGIHDYNGGGTSTPSDFQRSIFDTPSWSSAPNDQEISELLPTGATSSFVDVGDIIELGFFDTDYTTPTEDVTSDQSATYTPNTDSSSLFKGVWTPLTQQTEVGYNYGTNVIPEGLYWFALQMQASTDSVSDAGENFVGINMGQNSGTGVQIKDELDGNTGEDNLGSNGFTAAFDRVKALHASGSDPYIGIRFYDDDSKANGSTRYNTIMNPDWTFTDGEELYLQAPASGAATANLEFEFANSSYSSTLIGTGGSNAVGSSDYVATIAYYDGSSSLDITNSGVGDIILSGMHKDSSGGTITVGDDNTLTINSTSGNTFDFSGDIEGASGAGASTLVKVGAGEQIITGDVNLAGSSSGWVDILEGTLTFNPDSGKTQSVEYVKNSSGTPTLKLDNTGIGTGQIVELGFANTTSAQTFSGGVTLSGSNGTSNKIKIASGATDYSKEQILSGAITGTNTLVKDGAGRLVLTGDSTTSFSGNITVDDGTLVIGDGSSDGSNLDNDNTITINKGKLEIADNETVTLTAQGGSGKSMIGGKGTISTVTIGDASGEVDYISPGRGISSSLSPSQKGVDFDASTDSIGALTVATLNWNSGGVFDWQIKDFDPAGGTAGTDWDKLNFTTLNFESGQTFDINILAVQNDGTAGNVSNNSNTWNKYSTNNGFLFLQGTTVNNLSDGDVTSSFNIRSDDFNYQIGHYYGDWGVYKDGGNFYLTYSAVPEPSTYIMVTGLFLLPGWRCIRRLRATAKGDEQSEV
ncbi:MAG: autotransporter-associated beta strand repeat-containing protein [Opitutales bacterium]